MPVERNRCPGTLPSWGLSQFVEEMGDSKFQGHQANRYSNIWPRFREATGMNFQTGHKHHLDVKHHEGTLSDSKVMEKPEGLNAI
jgi:hypothetical protein